jgi:hypothetical protein
VSWSLGLQGRGKPQHLGGSACKEGQLASGLILVEAASNLGASGRRFFVQFWWLLQVDCRPVNLAAVLG